MTGDERAIRELLATWMAASKARDTETVLSLMTEDVVFLVAGHEPMRGRAAFAAANRALPPNMAMDVEQRTEEIVVSGDIAYARNHLTVTMTPNDGGASKRRSGYVLSVFRREGDGQWRLARDANLLTPDPSA